MLLLLLLLVSRHGGVLMLAVSGRVGVSVLLRKHLRLLVVLLVVTRMVSCPLLLLWLLLLLGRQRRGVGHRGAVKSQKKNCVNVCCLLT